MVLENELSSNEEIIKNATWHDCKSGLCPIDWLQRYPEKEFISHMVAQDTLISGSIITEKNLTMEDIENLLKNGDFDFDQMNSTRGDIINERSRRWSIHEPIDSYKCDGRFSKLVMITGGLAALAIVLGAIMIFVGFKSRKNVKIRTNQSACKNERARLYN